MNYRQLGKRAAKMLIRKAEESGAEESTAQESATEEKYGIRKKYRIMSGQRDMPIWMIPGRRISELVREYPKAGKYPAIKYCNSGQPGSLYYENVFQTVYPENGN